MEKSRTIWYSARSFLGIVAWVIAAHAPLEAKEVFDVTFCMPPANFDYSKVKTVSFFFPGNKDVDADAMIKSIAKGKAEVIVTGKTSIEGEALAPTISTYVMIHRNVEEKSWLVTINSFIYATASKSLFTDGDKFKGMMTISGNSLVFADGTTPQEIEEAISAHLQPVVDQIISSSKTKAKFFVVH